MGQWGLHFSAADMCHQHEVSADIGIASRMIASTDATILNRHVMFLSRYYGGLSALAVTQITATCTHARLR